MILDGLSKTIDRVIHGVMRRIAPKKAHLLSVKKIAGSYDMMRNADEKFFARIYLSVVLTALQKEHIPGKTMRILDAGCGQGRLCIPLSKEGHIVDAVDSSEKCIASAKKYAEQENAPVRFSANDILAFLRGVEDKTYDCVICTEVLYMMPDYEEALKELARVIKDGGLIIVAVRTKLYYVQYYLQRCETTKALSVVEFSNGRGHGSYLNWFTRDELRAMLESCRIGDIRFFGLGVASGIEGDPQANYVRPSLLAEEDLKILYDIEMSLATLYPEAGRYIVAIGKKRNA